LLFALSFDEEVRKWSFDIPSTSDVSISSGRGSSSAGNTGVIDTQQVLAVTFKDFYLKVDRPLNAKILRSSLAGTCHLTFLLGLWTQR
jgi:hypothetical protein